MGPAREAKQDLFPWRQRFSRFQFHFLGFFEMRSRFELDQVPSTGREPQLIDPEAFDASEQEFAASLEQAPSPSKPRFVVDEEQASIPANGAVDENTRGAVGCPEPEVTISDSSGPKDENAPNGGTGSMALSTGTVQKAATHEESVPAEPDPEAWRQEVQARISRYRARKQPRAPRYPSLQLKFESQEPAWRDAVPAHPATVATPKEVFLPAQAVAPTIRSEPVLPTSVVPPHEPAQDEAVGKILEFPRPSASPVPVHDELAEPVFDRPRILEVPEVLPPPPALGGILIEPAEQPVAERRPGFELPLQAAPMFRRFLAGAIDWSLVAAAVALFAYTFFKITSIVLPLRQTVLIAAALLAVFWAGYQYLLIIYAGTTPGLKLAKLRLSRFDGGSVARTTRRWRVLASWLSGLSLALGYAWCFLDEDRLCWHDRITHTYMAPKTRK
jgi:uncharacterized RDD family membrane protein YckC